LGGKGTKPLPSPFYRSSYFSLAKVRNFTWRLWRIAYCSLVNKFTRTSLVEAPLCQMCHKE
jgi:hypothetical protein